MYEEKTKQCVTVTADNTSKSSHILYGEFTAAVNI